VRVALRSIKGSLDALRGGSVSAPGNRGASAGGIRSATRWCKAGERHADPFPSRQHNRNGCDANATSNQDAALAASAAAESLTAPPNPRRDGGDFNHP
jgi:hypothetical protein